MELRQLRYVITVAEELHFGRAAEREHITVSALSQQVVRLERELGLQLFDRTSRVVSLTPAGAAFVAQARLALAAVERAASSAVQARRAQLGSVVVGFTSHGAGRLMSAVLQRFTERHPQAQVQLRELSIEEHFTALTEMQVDVQFARLPLSVPGLGTLLLAKEPRVAVLHGDHSLADAGSVGLDDLVGEVFFQLPALVPRAWREHFVPPVTESGTPLTATGPVVHSVHELLGLVGAGRGVGLVPASMQEFLARPDVRFVPAEVEPSRLALAWREGPRLPLVDAFVTTARAVITEPPFV